MKNVATNPTPAQAESVDAFRAHIKDRIKAAASLKDNWIQRMTLDQVENTPEAVRMYFTAMG